MGQGIAKVSGFSSFVVETQILDQLEAAKDPSVGDVVSYLVWYL